MRSEPVSGATLAKQRSVSLNRTEDCAIREAPVVQSPQHTDSPKPSAGSSSVKLARSKSSVEKKIQHEVAVFWRRTKEGKLFHNKKELGANADQVIKSFSVLITVRYFLFSLYRTDQQIRRNRKSNAKICAKSNVTRRKRGKGATPAPPKRIPHRRSCPGSLVLVGAAED